MLESDVMINMLPKDSGYILILISLFLVTDFILLPFYSYNINPDGISYISISQKYLKGDLGNAVNGYWGPLFSWLLVPLLAINIEPVYASRMLLIFLGALCLLGIWLLAEKLKIKGWSLVIILTASFIMLISFSLSEITPDLLLTALLIYYFILVIGKKCPAHKIIWPMCGVFGSLLYFAKVYGFYFFITHFFIINLVYFLKEPDPDLKKAVITNYLTGMAVFVLISSFWIIPLTRKYQNFTVGTTSNFAWSLTISTSGGNPILVRGLMPLPNGTAVSAWEDPSSFFPQVKLSNLYKDLQNRLFLIEKNIISLFTYGLTYVPSALIAIPLLVMGAFNTKSSDRTREVLPYFLTAILYPIGYVPLYVEPRFLWVAFLLLLILSSHLVVESIPKIIGSSVLRVYLLACLIILLVVAPITDLAQHFQFHKDIYGLGSRLKTEIGSGLVNLASNANYNESLEIAYLVNGHYYGLAALRSLVESGSSNKFNINYYLDWSGGDKEKESEARLVALPSLGLDAVRVYRVR